MLQKINKYCMSIVSYIVYSIVLYIVLYVQIVCLCISPNFRYSVKRFAEIYRAQYENVMLVYLRGTPIGRPENSVNISNLLWPSTRLMISTEKTRIYVSTFPNALTS